MRTVPVPSELSVAAGRLETIGSGLMGIVEGLTVSVFFS